jgi:hypothetical protein
VDVLRLAKKGPLGDGNLGSTRANSQQLGRNMALEGRSVMSGQAAGHIVASGSKVNRWEPDIESRQIIILILMILLMGSLLVILAFIMKCIIENFMKRYEID